MRPALLPFYLVFCDESLLTDVNIRFIHDGARGADRNTSCAGGPMRGGIAERRGYFGSAIICTFPLRRVKTLLTAR